MVANHMPTPRQLLHHLHLVLEILLLLLGLADQLFKGVVLLRVGVLDQENIAVASLCNLMDLFETFAVDVEAARAPEQSPN